MASDNRLSDLILQEYPCAQLGSASGSNKIMEARGEALNVFIDVGAGVIITIELPGNPAKMISIYPLSWRS